MTIPKNYYTLLIKMEKQASSQEILSLGRKIIAELNLSDSSDTLSQWMVHYLSEKMNATERATGSKKNALEKECFELILRLWEHRANLPGKIAPLASLKPVIKFLKSLSKGVNDDLFSYFSDRRDNIWLKFAGDANSAGNNVLSLLIFLQTLPLSFINAKRWTEDHKKHLAQEEMELITELDTVVERIDHYYGLTREERTPTEMLEFILEKNRKILEGFTASHAEFDLAAKQALDKLSKSNDADANDSED